MTALVSPQAARSEPRRTFLAAPYSDASSAARCNDDLEGSPLYGVTGTCAPLRTSADAATGAMSLDVGLHANPATQKGLASADAHAEIVAEHELTEHALALRISATIDVTKFVYDPYPQFQRGAVVASIRVASYECFGCTVTATSVITEPGRFELAEVLVPPDGSPIPAGSLMINVAIDASPYLGGSDTACLVVDANLAEIEVTRPSLERVIHAPFADADNYAQCSAYAGTVEACAVGASSSTGRFRVDLSVQSPLNGSAPGYAGGHGFAAVVVEDETSERCDPSSTSSIST